MTDPTRSNRMAAIMAIALVAHEANRAWCMANGDMSQPTWENAPDWQKESAVNGVDFHLSVPDAGADASHNNWLAHKQADGWTYGEVKDPIAKTHYCMVPFDQLPPVQQAKDRMFRAIVHALAEGDERLVWPIGEDQA